jgi:hypothetical protein
MTRHHTGQHRIRTPSSAKKKRKEKKSSNHGFKIFIGRFLWDSARSPGVFGTYYLLPGFFVF